MIINIRELLIFVMARKEVGYIPGTRTPIVVPGDLYDDLARRDFTVNALARDPDTGEIIDYFDGLKDLEKRVLKTILTLRKWMQYQRREFAKNCTNVSNVIQEKLFGT